MRGSIAIFIRRGNRSRLFRQRNSSRHVEAVEPRLLFNAYTVTTVANSGAGSLRNAILAANSHPGFDDIRFNIPGSGPRVITPTTPLPALTDTAEIDGLTEPGAHANTAALGSADNASLRIVLKGSAAGATADGLDLRASNSSVQGLVIQGFLRGIQIERDNDVVVGNFIGLTANGTASTTAGNFIGVDVGDFFGSPATPNVIDARIGGRAPADRNLIGDNGVGVELSNSFSGAVYGNYVGVATDGHTAAPNATGVEAVDSTDDSIGGALSGQGNVISGNAPGSHGGFGIGVNLVSLISGTQVIGNRIGTNAAGTAALGNVADGIFIEGGAPADPVLVMNNLISGNMEGMVVQGLDDTQIIHNFIGTNLNANAAIGNTDWGINVNAGSGGDTTISADVISGNISGGIFLQGSFASVDSCKIGVDGAATHPLPNHGPGILLTDLRQETPDFYNPSDVNDNIGGTTTATANIISANQGPGVLENGGANDRLLHNFIGTDPAGDAGLGNTMDGVEVTAGVLIIGAVDSTFANIISGNGGNGINLASPSQEPPDYFGGVETIVFNNIIGATPAGNAALPNAGDGVHIDGSSFNVIGVRGGTDDAVVGHPENIIAYNGGDGIGVVGNSATLNTFRGNSIFSNHLLGIDLGRDGVTPNDLHDVDTGPNDLLNSPVISSAHQIGHSLNVQGTYSGLSSTEFDIDLYASDSLHSPARTYIGTVVVTTDADGNAGFTFTTTAMGAAGQFITATATGDSRSAEAIGGANTSEFSNIADSLQRGFPQAIYIAALPWFPGGTTLPAGAAKDPTIAVRFSQDVSASLDAGDVVLFDPKSQSAMKLTSRNYDHKKDIATFTFAGVQAGTYVFMLIGKGITNSSGTPLNGTGPTITTSITFTPLGNIKMAN